MSGSLQREIIEVLRRFPPHEFVAASIIAADVSGSRSPCTIAQSCRSLRKFVESKMGRGGGFRLKNRSTAGIILAGILSLSMLSSSFALDCTRASDRTPGPNWRYRIIDHERCWYQSEYALPKSELTWAKTESESKSDSGSPRPELTMEFGDAPVRPTYVRTISYKPAEPSTEIPYLHIGILAAFGLVIGGLVWPLRRRRT